MWIILHVAVTEHLPQQVVADLLNGPTINGVMMKIIVPIVIGMVVHAVTMTFLDTLNIVLHVNVLIQVMEVQLQQQQQLQLRLPRLKHQPLLKHQRQLHQQMGADLLNGLTINGVMMKTIMQPAIGMEVHAVTMNLLDTLNIVPNVNVLTPMEEEIQQLKDQQ